MQPKPALEHPQRPGEIREAFDLPDMLDTPGGAGSKSKGERRDKRPALRTAAEGSEARAIKIQLEAFNRASNEFASRRMDKSIRGALAGQKIDDIRL